MKILRTWREGDICQQGSPIIALPPEGCGCNNPSICCEGGCCMYPADESGAGYSAADLPDEVIVQFPNESPSTWSRSGSYFVSGNLSLRPVGARWALFNNEDEVGDRSVQCLIEPDLLAPRVTDNFADTYEVSGPVNGTVARQSVCVWTGAGLTLSNRDYQWQVNGRNKIGLQNTPVGSYADGYSVNP